MCLFHSTSSFQALQALPEELEKSDFVGTILIDLSKTYDCWSHDLLIAKFEASGIHNTGLSLNITTYQTLNSEQN